MRVLGFYRHAWPIQRGGSEVGAHRVLSWLADRGHEVSAIVTHQRAIPTDGVQYVYGQRRALMNAWREADVVITHQAASGQAVELSEQYGPPVLHWSHNWRWFDALSHILRPERDVVAWNSHAVADLNCDSWDGRSIVLHPPTFPDQYRRSTGKLVTQVNLNELKGGRVFWEVARAMPEVQFLAVVGGWLEQVDRHGVLHHPHHAVAPLSKSAYSNVEVIGTTEDMVGDVWDRTRLLIIPTGLVNDTQVGESWGLVAAEATCSGIPVIATRSPGMEELLDGTGFLIDDYDDADAWMHAIRTVDANHSMFAADALERAKCLDPTDELEQVEQVLLEMVG